MPRNATFSRAQIALLLVCVAIFALGQFHRAGGSVFTPILMERFALGAASVGALVSAMFFASIAAQMPFGVALDRIGARPVLTGCILLVGLGTALFAAGGGFNSALASRMLIGIGLASMGAASHVIIARAFPARDFGYVSGLVVTLGGIGGLLGTYPLALALSRLPWDAVFGTVAAATFLLAAAIFRAVPPGRAEMPSASAGGGYWDLLRQAEIRRILVLSIVTYAPITTITGLWGGPYLQQVVGLSPEQAGAALLLLFCATISGGFVFGLLDRWAPSRRAVILCGAAASSLALFALALVPEAGLYVSVPLLLTMVFSQQFYVPLGAHLRHAVPEHVLARASSLFSLVAVTAIPTLQLGFGAALDLGAVLGWDEPQRFGLAFGGMGALVAICALIYASGPRKADSA